MKNKVIVLMMISAIILNLTACSKYVGINPDKDGTDKIPVSNAKEILFEQSLTMIDKNLDLWGGSFFWSPDGRYAIVDAMSTKAGASDSSVIALVDIQNNKLVRLMDGYLGFYAEWSKDSKRIAFMTKDGLTIYSIGDQSFTKVSEKGYMPQFSPDNSKLIYMNEGLWVYDVAGKSSSQITKGKYDAAPLWFSDSKRVFFFRDNGKNLGDGAGNEQVLSIVDTSENNRISDINIDMKGKFRSAKWLDKDEKLFIHAGWDDGHSYHILNLSNNELLKDIAGQEDYIVFNAMDKKLIKYKGYPSTGALKVYDYNMKRLMTFYIDNDKEYPAASDNLEITALDDNRLVYLHVNQQESKGALMITYLSDGRQTRITDYGRYSNPFVSQDGKLLAYIENGHILKIVATDKLKEVNVEKVISDSRVISELSEMLPDRAEQEWKYNGFAEYGHTLRIDGINVTPEGAIQYLLSGKVDDMSGGEAKGDFDIYIEYIVSKEGIKEIIKEGEKLPHKINEFFILKYPLAKGNTWTQQVAINSIDTELKAEITDVAVDKATNGKIVKVQYTAPVKGMPNDTYKETRTFLEGVGLVDFENTFDKDIEFNYSLMRK